MVWLYIYISPNQSPPYCAPSFHTKHPRPVRIPSSNSPANLTRCFGSVSVFFLLEAWRVKISSKLKFKTQSKFKV